MTTDDVIDFFIRPQALFLTATNFFLCMLVAWACMCRMRLTSTDTLISVRLVHTAVFVMAICSGFRGPLFGVQVTTWWPVTQMGCLLSMLLINMRAWKHAAPFIMQKASRPMTLEDEARFAQTEVLADRPTGRRFGDSV